MKNQTTIKVREIPQRLNAKEFLQLTEWYIKTNPFYFGENKTGKIAMLGRNIRIISDPGLNDYNSIPEYIYINYNIENDVVKVEIHIKSKSGKIDIGETEIQLYQ